MKNKYKIITFQDEEGDYIATCKEMPSISGIGDTESEAVEEYKIAMSLVEEIMEEDGTPMPLKQK